MKWSLFILVSYYEICFGISVNNFPVEDMVGSDFSIVPEINKYVFLSFHHQGAERMTRDIGSLKSKLPHIEQTLKVQCEKNLKQLDPAIESMKTCLDAKPIFITPKDEYIKHIDHCSNETREILTECLPTKYKYFPQLLFKVVESVVGLVYDDSHEIINGLAPCIPKLKTEESQIAYLQCISRVNQKFEDKFPESKKEFCDEFVEVSQCFVTQINATCTINDALVKFTKDYMTAIKNPCK